MLHDVAQHLGISDDEAQRAVALAVERGWLTTDGGEPAAQREFDLGLGHALGTLDLIQVAHDHGGDQGETDGDGGGQSVTAMIEPVVII